MRIPVYRYETRREDGTAETQWTLVETRGQGYAGHAEHSDAHPMANDGGEADAPTLAGHVEAPDGTTVVTPEPPTVEVPGRGQVALAAVIGSGEGEVGGTGRDLRWQPA